MLKQKNILIACEESQTICKEFRKKGFNAFSCDILDCSGGCPQWHIKADCIPLLEGNCSFKTQDNKEYYVDKWHLIIAHPPCTFLTLHAQKWLNPIYNYDYKIRQQQQKYALQFFNIFLNIKNCDHVAIENPIGIIPRYFRKYDQIIKPCYFGDPCGKKTCLWLKGLPLLEKTNVVPIEYHISKTGRKWDKWFWDSSMISDLKERSRFRSKTFEGIAIAIVEQWSNVI